MARARCDGRRARRDACAMGGVIVTGRCVRDVQCNYTRGSASAEEPRDALRQLKYYGCFVTELLTRSFANAEEPCSTLSVEIV